jgi:hypothetical protein
MAALVFLVLAILCSLIARALLIKAAFGISWKWGFGVFVPFGPLVFRLNYPDEARRARLFQLATLPCIFFYWMNSPGLPSGKVAFPRSFKLPGYGTEPTAPAPKQVSQASLEERRAANDREFQRLRRLSEELRIRKRDLLKSDTEGAVAYNKLADEYNASLDKYNAEKFSLTLLPDKTAVAVKTVRP